MSDFDENSEPSSRAGSGGSTSTGRKRASPATASSSCSSSNKKSRKSSKSPDSQKSNRGLRHFSMMVCQRVEEKGTTTYNEVADELVRKVLAEREEKESAGKFDEKNIRRRVYDALNVLMAMDIISKEKKEITWKGLPSANRQDLESMREEVQIRRQELQTKRDALQELIQQQVCFRNLVEYNHNRGHSEEKIPLPFVVVNTNSKAVIQCDMSRDRTDVMFDFSMPFEIKDDNTILKRMGMDKTSNTVLHEMLPSDLMDYCHNQGLLDTVVTPERPPSRHSPEPHPFMHRKDGIYHHRSTISSPHEQHHHYHPHQRPMPHDHRPHEYGYDPLGV